VSAFRELVDARSVAPGVVVQLPLSAWASDWHDRPLEPMPIGLRVPSEADFVFCRAEAARKAWTLHPREDDQEGRVEAYNSHLMVGALARATCQPDNATAHFWATPDDLIPRALTSTAIKALFDELVRLTIAESACRPEATEADIAQLAELLQTGELRRRLTPAEWPGVSKLLRYCLEQLE
jgi:hypothetical protein